MIPDGFPAGTLLFGPEENRLREHISRWLRAHDPGAPSESYEVRIREQISWQAELHEGGFVGLSWPTQYGGSGLGLAAEAVLAEELAGSGMPELINRIGVYMIGPTLIDLASEGQRERFLSGMLDASELWCQGFSEPEAGSDLAAVRTHARVDGQRLIVNGQKLWTSRAGLARWCAALVRSDREQQRHRGLSMAIIDMSDPGITVRPMPQILGEPHFNEVFFDDVQVPIENVIGGLGEGWKVAMQMLSYERGLFALERMIRLRGRLDELGKEIVRLGLSEDASVRQRVGSVHAQLEILEAQLYRTLAAQQSASVRAGATSVDKLLLSRAYQELFALATDLLGRATARERNSWTHDLLESRGVSIYGGTTEIQFGIIARQLLGMKDAA